MAKLNIQARDARLARHGGARTTLILSVTDDTGAPVADLEADDIAIAPIPIAGVRPGTLVAEVTAPAPGIYAAELGLGGWQPGRHVLAVIIVRRFERGQCLATLEIT